MVTIISIWFKSLSKKMKIVTIFIFVILIALSVQTIRLARSEYLRLKGIEKEFKQAQKDIKDSEEKEFNIINNHKNKSKKTILKNKDINKKLKQDEKTINDSNVSDSDLYDFISRHEKEN